MKRAPGDPRCGGDVDGDGRADALLLQPVDDATTLVPFLSSGMPGAPGPSTARTWWTSDPGALDPARARLLSGDLGGDGRADAAILRSLRNATCELRAYLSSPDVGGSYVPGAVWCSRTGGLALSRAKPTIGDVDGDGRADVVVLYDLGNGTSSLRVFLSRTGGFALRTLWKSSPGAVPFARVKAACGDVDGDGRCDVILLQRRGDGRCQLRVLRSTGDGFASHRYWLSRPNRFSFAGSRLAAGDVDGDGRCDLVVLYDYGAGTTGLRVFLAGDGSFTPRVYWKSASGAMAWSRARLTTGDIDADGRSDVALLYREPNGAVTLNAFVSRGAAFFPHLVWTAPPGDLLPTTTRLAVNEAALVTVPVEGRTFYVAPDGDNADPGTSDAPWATPGYGSRQLQPGDTLIIRAGTYHLWTYPDDILTPPSGTVTAPVTIRGEAGARPVLAGGDNLAMAVDLSNTDYVTVRDLEITSDGGDLFREGINGLGGPVDHATLRNLYIHHIDEGGIDIGDADHVEIADCRIQYCGFGAIGGPAGERGGWRNVTVRGCDLSYSGHYYQGVLDNPDLPYDRPDGLGLEPSQGPLTIVDTVAGHNRGDGLDSKIANTTIERCLVANNSCDGVKLWQGGSSVVNTLIYGTGDGVGGASPWAGIVIDQVEQSGGGFSLINVTVHDNPSRTAYPMYVAYDSGSVPLHLTIRNSIFAGGHGEVFCGNRVDLDVDHTLFWRPEGDPQLHANGRDYDAGEIRAGALGAANLVADPRFVAPAWGSAGDYRLRAASPAVDAGTGARAPATDLVGVTRPQGAAVDLGAYERSVAGP